MPRDEFIIHFVLDGTGFYSAGGQTWSLTPGQMFVIYPNEPVTYGADETNPWSYAWIGFRGIRAHSMVKNVDFPKSISTSCTGSENNPETHRLYAES